MRRTRAFARPSSARPSTRSSSTLSSPKRFSSARSSSARSSSARSPAPFAHALVRPLALLALSVLFALACDSDRREADGTKTASADKPTKSGEPADATQAGDKKTPDKKAAPFATPTAKPPPPPEGVALLEKPRWLYVQRCDKSSPCPKLLQPAGEEHCRELVLGQRDSWRLPDRDEVEGLTAIKDQLEDLESGFHWTRTPYDEDPQQVWIVDPLGGYKTTVPRARKPFTIRCVQEP